MALPPQLIRVKRKRDEEAPITFLQLESTPKRHRGDGGPSNWVYQRKADGPGQTSQQLEPPSQVVRPVIQETKSGDEHRIAPTRQHDKQPLFHKENASPIPSNASLGGSRESNHIPQPAKETAATLSDKSPDRRRFHYSRAASTFSSRIGASGISKRERYGAVFIEKRKSEGDSPRSKRLSGPVHQAVTPKANHETSKNGIKGSDKQTNSGLQNEARRPLPSVNAAVDSMDHVAATMNAWALEEIGANLEAFEATRSTEPPKKKPSRFRPKAPAKRWAERNPELAQKSATLSPPTTEVHLTEDDKSSVTGDSDSDCVYDTYERVPVGLMASQCNPGDVGVLVIDDEDDVECFYLPEQDSEDEEEDEEDENAETYYTADYPEDELDSDDEHGWGAYKYRNGNASDEEEYLGINDDDNYGEIAHEGDIDDNEAILARVRRFNRHINSNQRR